MAPFLASGAVYVPIHTSPYNVPQFLNHPSLESELTGVYGGFLSVESGGQRAALIPRRGFIGGWLLVGFPFWRGSPACTTLLLSCGSSDPSSSPSGRGQRDTEGVTEGVTDRRCEYLKVRLTERIDLGTKTKKENFWS